MIADKKSICILDTGDNDEFCAESAGTNTWWTQKQSRKENIVRAGRFRRRYCYYTSATAFRCWQTSHFMIALLICRPLFFQKSHTLDLILLASPMPMSESLASGSCSIEKKKKKRYSKDNICSQTRVCSHCASPLSFLQCVSVQNASLPFSAVFG